MRKITYLKYLTALITSHIDTEKQYKHSKLVSTLYKTPFVWLVANDDNRIADGVKLRDEYLDLYPGHFTDTDFNECSVLEMLIALARRMEFESEQSFWYQSTAMWFWNLIIHLDLYVYDNTLINFEPLCLEDMRKKINRFVSREYSFNGIGGLFPLKRPTADQRNVEIWYQMTAWINENFNN